jgi:putative transcriptional regulator
MSKRAFDKIAEGIKEAIEIARGARKPAKLYVPPEIAMRAGL